MNLIESLLWAHPRVSGENAQKTLMIELGKGSSPRERGKLNFGQQFNNGIGLIPA